MLDALRDIVRTVGEEVRSLAGSDSVRGVQVGDQLKTEADRRAHDALRNHLAALAPDLPVVSEEDTASQRHNRPRRYFLIDPIDGTASLAHGFSGYVTQIALMEDDNPALAAIHAPALGQTFLAGRGMGAWRDDIRLRVDANGTRRVLIDNYPQPKGFAAEVFSALGCSGYVECGSLALKICRIADGTADLFVKDVPVRDWDIAPADLILSEAGGILSLPDGTSFAYTGPLEKHGIMAYGSRASGAAFAAWFKSRKTP